MNRSVDSGPATWLCATCVLVNRQFEKTIVVLPTGAMLSKQFSKVTPEMTMYPCSSKVNVYPENTTESGAFDVPSM